MLEYVPVFLYVYCTEICFTYLQHKRDAGREKGHKHKVVSQDRHATEAAHDLKLSHTCRNEEGKIKSEQICSMLIFCLVWKGDIYLKLSPHQSPGTPQGHQE